MRFRALKEKKEDLSLPLMRFRALKEKKEDIWLMSMTKAPIPTEIQRSRVTTQNVTTNFKYITIGVTPANKLVWFNLFAWF